MTRDLNVHSVKWLRHSTRETAEGFALASQSAELGLRQMVRAPTRGPYLLDLVPSGLEDIDIQVQPGLSDHIIVSVDLRIAVPKATHVSRQVWG